MLSGNQEKNGNRDLCSHTGDFDTLKAGMRSRGLTSRQSYPASPRGLRMEPSRREAAHKHPSMQQSGTGSHNCYVSTRTMAVHGRVTESRHPPGANAREPWDACHGSQTFPHGSQACGVGNLSLNLQLPLTSPEAMAASRPPAPPPFPACQLVDPVFFRSPQS